MKVGDYILWVHRLHYVIFGWFLKALRHVLTERIKVSTTRLLQWYNRVKCVWPLFMRPNGRHFVQH